MVAFPAVRGVLSALGPHRLSGGLGRRSPHPSTEQHLSSLTLGWTLPHQLQAGSVLGHHPPLCFLKVVIKVVFIRSLTPLALKDLYFERKRLSTLILFLVSQAKKHTQQVFLR